MTRRKTLVLLLALALLLTAVSFWYFSGSRRRPAALARRYYRAVVSRDLGLLWGCLAPSIREAVARQREIPVDELFETWKRRVEEKETRLYLAWRVEEITYHGPDEAVVAVRLKRPEGRDSRDALRLRKENNQWYLTNPRRIGLVD